MRCLGFSSSCFIVSFDVKTGVDGGVDTGLTSIVVGSGCSIFLVATGVAVMDTELTVFLARTIVADPRFVGAIFLDATGVEGLVAGSCTVLTALVAGGVLGASPLVTTAGTFELVAFLAKTGVPAVGSDSELMFFLLKIGVAVSGLVTLSCTVGRLVAFLARMGVPVVGSCTILTALVAGGGCVPLKTAFRLVVFLARTGVPTVGSDSELMVFLDKIGVAVSDLVTLSVVVEVTFGEEEIFPAMGW